MCAPVTQASVVLAVLLSLEQLLLWRVCNGEHTCTTASVMGDMGDLRRRVCRKSSACQRIQRPAQTVGLNSVIAVQSEATDCHIVKLLLVTLAPRASLHTTAIAIPRRCLS